MTSLEENFKMKTLLAAGVLVAGAIAGYSLWKDAELSALHNYDPTSCYQATEKQELRSPANDSRYGCQRP